MARSLADLDELMGEGAGRSAPASYSQDDDETESYRVTAAELRAFIERLERLAAEKAEIADQEKEVKAEAKGRGYDTKVMTRIIALRKRNRDDVAEEGAVMEMYCEALGMDFALV